jgi:hypothetical protein
MDQYEASLRVAIILFVIVYFPIVTNIPKSISLSILLLSSACIVIFQEKFTDKAIFLVRFVLLYHAYTILIEDVIETPIVSLLTIPEAFISIAYTYNRIPHLEHALYLTCGLLKTYGVPTDERMVIVYLVWQFETHFGRENDSSYLRVLLIPIIRLPEIPCKIYSLIVLSMRVYATYRKTYQQTAEIQMVEEKIEEPAEEVIEEVVVEEVKPEEPITPPAPPAPVQIPPSPPKKQRKKQVERKAREKVARKLDFSSMMEEI